MDRFWFSECAGNRVDAFVACAARQMEQGKGKLLDDEPKVGGNGRKRCIHGGADNMCPHTPQQSLHFVDDIYSVGPHTARSFAFASDTVGSQVSPDCAYVVHANNANWDIGETPLDTAQ